MGCRERLLDPRRSVAEKSNSVDLVTETDVRCEQLVAARIRAAFPDHALIGEESAEGEGGARWKCGAAGKNFVFVGRVRIAVVSNVV